MVYKNAKAGVIISKSEQNIDSYFSPVSKVNTIQTLGVSTRFHSFVFQTQSGGMCIAEAPSLSTLRAQVIADFDAPGASNKSSSTILQPLLAILTLLAGTGIGGLLYLKI